MNSLGMIVLGAGVVLGAMVGGVLILNSPKKEKQKGDGPCIVCIGDSITFGSGVLLTRGKDAWPQILGQILDGKYEVLNYGISGATLLSSGDQPYRMDFWKTAKEKHARIYILMLGTNDSKPQNWDAQKYAEELTARVTELKENPSVEAVYLMAPPPAFPKKESDQYAIYHIDPNVIQNELYAIIKECTASNQVGFIDLFRLLNGHPEYFSDGVHPNAEGNRVIAEYISQSIQQGPLG